MSEGSNSGGDVGINAAADALDAIPTIAPILNDAVDAVASVATNADLFPVFIAYAALLLMAMIPIYFGAKLSVQKAKEVKKEEIMTQQDAAMFPVFASGALFSLYLLYKFVSKELLNSILGNLMIALSIGSVATFLRPMFVPVCPAWFEDSIYKFEFTRRNKKASQTTTTTTTASSEGKAKAALSTDASNTTTTTAPKSDVEEIVLFEFDYVFLVSLAFSVIIAGIYLKTNNWIANNIIALSLSVNGISVLNLGSYVVGCILLGGLFFYDIFWVFGTDVMVTVATKFNAPIKVVFPKDIFASGVLFADKNLGMLGLGDIVIPGIFIALLMRYDLKHNRANTPYFWTTYIAYFLGLFATMFVMHVFKAAQPALLYLVPACVLASFLCSVVRGETKELLKYQEEAQEETQTVEVKKSQ